MYLPFLMKGAFIRYRTPESEEFAKPAPPLI